MINLIKVITVLLRGDRDHLCLREQRGMFFASYHASTLNTK
jgi:hypothetical protein